MQTMDVINQLNRLHERYKRYIRMGIVTAVIFAMKGFLIFPLFWLLRLHLQNTTIINIVLLIIIGYFVKQCFVCKRQYARIYKENFVTAVMNEMFSDVQVDWERGFSQKQVREMEIIDMGDEFKFRDVIRGCGLNNPMSRSKAQMGMGTCKVVFTAIVIV